MKILLALLLFFSCASFASDHDDGELDLKGRALNITDVFAFREDWQSGNGGDANNLILIMNVNPRSLPGQTYFFSNQARYNFHLTRNSSSEKAVRPTGREDVVFRLYFDNPTAGAANQTFRVEASVDGQTFNHSETLETTALADASSPSNNNFNLDGKSFTAFAGLREDPFFFDVEQFFKVRSHALATNSFLGFLSPSQAKDFTHNYNVLSIVLRIPLDFINGGDANNNIFDVWTTIEVKQ